MNNLNGHWSFAPEGTAGWVLIASAAGFVALALGRFALLRLYSRPLDRLIAVSGRVRFAKRMPAEERDQAVQLARRRDRLGELARTLVDMADDSRRRVVELSTLLDTGRKVASSLKLDEVFDNLLGQLEVVFEVDACSILTLDQRAGEFRVRANHGLSDEFAEVMRIDPADQHSPSMRALRSKAPVQVSDTMTDLAYTTGFRTSPTFQQYRSRLAIPLNTVYAPPAVLLLYKFQPYRYSYRELELASSLAGYASIALENAALHARTDEQLHDQTRRLEAIVESLEDGLVLEDPRGDVLFCNRSAARLAGLSPDEVGGRSADELLTLLAKRSVDPGTASSELAATRNGGDRDSVELTLAGDGGTDLRVQMFDVTDESGQRIGRGQLWQDVSEDRSLDRMKSALIATVSHELRSPLALIQGYASTLLADDVSWSADEQLEFLTTIHAESDRLARLVQNLLDLSRIEAGALDVRREPHSINQLVRRAVGAFPAESRKRVSLVMEPDLPLVDVDAERVEAVVRNLVDNAIKYSGAGSPVDVSTEQRNGDVVVNVRDRGPGVPDALAERIFEPFVRADIRLSRRVPGVGLGLSICRGVVEAHGGEMWMSPAEPGTTFAFSLPQS